MVVKKGQFNFLKTASGEKGKPRGKGALTAQAKRHGMTVQEFIKEVNKNPDKYRKITKQRVQLAKTLKSFRKA